MKNKAVVVVIILGSLIISIFAGCRQSPLKYIPPTIDSVNNDKSRMGLNGKVKTLDIYYYRPENTSSFFSVNSKKARNGKRTEYITTIFISISTAILLNATSTTNKKILSERPIIPMRLGDIHLHLAFRKLTVRLSVSIILTGNCWKLCIVIPMGR